MGSKASLLPIQNSSKQFRTEQRCQRVVGRFLSYGELIVSSIFFFHNFGDMRFDGMLRRIRRR